MIIFEANNGMLQVRLSSAIIQSTPTEKERESCLHIFFFFKNSNKSTTHVNLNYS